MDENLDSSGGGVIQTTNRRGSCDFTEKHRTNAAPPSVVRMATTVVGPMASHGFWRPDDQSPILCGDGELSAQVFKKSPRPLEGRAIYCRRLLSPA